MTPESSTGEAMRRNKLSNYKLELRFNTHYNVMNLNGTFHA
jgi:hypothetical protein